LLDTNANKFFDLTATASAVNYLTYANAATGNAPTLTATGTDANIGMRFVSKGNTNVVFEGDPGTGAARMNLVTNNTHVGGSKSSQFSFQSAGVGIWGIL